MQEGPKNDRRTQRRRPVIPSMWCRFWKNFGLWWNGTLSEMFAISLQLEWKANFRRVETRRYFFWDTISRPVLKATTITPVSAQLVGHLNFFYKTMPNTWVNLGTKSSRRMTSRSTLELSFSWMVQNSVERQHRTVQGRIFKVENLTTEHFTWAQGNGEKEAWEKQPHWFHCWMKFPREFWKPWTRQLRGLPIFPGDFLWWHGWNVSESTYHLSCVHLLSKHTYWPVLSLFRTVFTRAKKHPSTRRTPNCASFFLLTPLKQMWSQPRCETPTSFWRSISVQTGAISFGELRWVKVIPTQVRLIEMPKTKRAITISRDLVSKSDYLFLSVKRPPNEENDCESPNMLSIWTSKQRDSGEGCRCAEHRINFSNWTTRNFRRLPFVWRQEQKNCNIVFVLCILCDFRRPLCISQRRQTTTRSWFLISTKW